MGDPFEQVRARRAGLRAAIDRVERSLATPAPGRADKWRKEVLAELQALGEALEVHIAANEAPGGLLADIMEEAPRLAHRVNVLRDNHEQLRASLGAAVAAVEHDTGDDVTASRDRVVELLGGLVRHRHLGADLVYEAYNVDIEAAD